MKTTRTILFDLDGTLLDTAPDMANALNQLRAKHQLPPLPYSQLRPMVSRGARAMLTTGFNVGTDEDRMQLLLNEFLDLYAEQATNETCAFPGIINVLDYLDQEKISWGIVTNKPERFTYDILQSLNLHSRTNCVVCGDTLTKRKPDPEPVLHACKLLNQPSNNCIFVGDSIIDVTASKAAGTRILVALYGYIDANEEPRHWNADGYLAEPTDIITWLKANPATS